MLDNLRARWLRLVRVVCGIGHWYRIWREEMVATKGLTWKQRERYFQIKLRMATTEIAEEIKRLKKKVED